MITFYAKHYGPATTGLLVLFLAPYLLFTRLRRGIAGRPGQDGRT